MKEKNGKNSGPLTLEPVNCLYGDQLQRQPLEPIYISVMGTFDLSRNACW